MLWLGLPSRDLTPESLRGSNLRWILPSVLPVMSCTEHRVGSTDLSRLLERCCHRPGQCHLPDKEFRYLRTVLDVTNPRAIARRSRRQSGFGPDCFLHIAMQLGLYHPPDGEHPGPGVQSLRILLPRTTQGSSHPNTSVASHRRRSYRDVS